MPEPLEVLWSLAPAELKLQLSLSLVADILKAIENHRVTINLDDGNKYEIVMNKLEATTMKM